MRVTVERIIAMRRSHGGDYPDNWNEIATAVKAAAGWKCIRCGHRQDGLADEPGNCGDGGVQLLAHDPRGMGAQAMKKIITKIMDIILVSGVLTFAFTMGYEGYKDGRLQVLLNKADVTLPEILGAFLGIYMAFFITVSVIKSLWWLKRYLQDDDRIMRYILRNWNNFTLDEQTKIIEIVDEQIRRDAEVTK
jgi:hypothetical protein